MVEPLSLNFRVFTVKSEHLGNFTVHVHYCIA